MNLNETHTTYKQSMCEMEIPVDEGYYPVADGTSLDALAQISVCTNISLDFYSTCMPKELSKERFDAKRIRSEVFKLLGSRIIDLSISSVTRKEFKSDSNKDGMGILVRSHSNRYVRDNSALFGEILVSDLSDEEWRETFAEVAKYLKEKLGQEKVTYLCLDLPKAGEPKMITVQ